MSPWILLVWAARAHIPHENVWVLAPPPTLDASSPWVLVYQDADQYMMSRSEDGGETWSMLGADPLQDALLGGGQMNDGTLVLLGPDRYWYSTDFGDTWAEAALPGDVDQVWTADRLYLGGTDGIWSGTPGGTLTRELLTASITAFGPGPVAITTDHRVRRRQSTGLWIDEGSPASNLTAVAHSGGRTFAGDAAGTVYRRTSGTWSACAAIPDYGGDASEPSIRRIAVDGSTVVVAPAKHGPVSTGPTCSSWSDRGTGEDPYFRRVGGADDAEETWVYLGASGGRWVIAGWSGVSRSTDAGLTWDAPQVIPPDTTNAIVYSPGWPDHPRIWFSRFDETVMYTDDGGVSLTAWSHGMADLNAQFVHVAADPEWIDTVYAITNFYAYVSTDGGDSWSPFAADRGGVSAMRVWDDPDHVWLLSGTGVPVPVETLDGGATWTELTGLVGPLGGADPVHADTLPDATGAEYLCLLAQGPTTVVCSADGGATWGRVLRGVGVRVRGVVAVPEVGTDRLVVADDAGLWLTDDFGGSWADVTPWGDDVFVSLARTADGTLFAASESGRVGRSEDGGDTWEDLGVRLTAYTYDIAPRPDWLDVDEVLFATHDGAFVLRDAAGAAPTLERWMDVQRVDSWSGYTRCEGCPAKQYDPSASMDSIQPLAVGSVAWTRVRGGTVRVYGTSAGSGMAAVVVDGVVRGSVGATVTASPALLIEVTGLDAGEHLVEVVGVAGTGVEIDAFEGDGGSDPLSPAAEVDADGDGQPSVADGGLDCDDDDPTVYSGAPETWYDGVDQNCDGASDYDRDADGYDSSGHGGTDCNDYNRLVRPGASETWYDGVDQNCDGADDYDRDGDGYRATAYGGTDCDDTRARIRPGTREIVGNGIDENCNGSDAT